MRQPLLNANLRWFLVGMILANVASDMVFVLLPVYLSELGASVGQIGLVFSVASIVPLVLQIMGGWLSDSIGRLKTIALGSAVASLGYVGFILAPSWPWVLAALCVEYVSGSLVGPSFGAYVAEQSAEELRGRVFGLANGIFMIVAVVGPLLAGGLAGRFGFKIMLTVAAVLYLLATGLRLWMARAERFAPVAAPEPLSLAGFRTKMGAMLGLLAAGGVVTWILVTDGVSDVAFRLSGELLPVYLAKIGGVTVAQIGWLQSLRGLAMIAATVPSGWLADRRGERSAIVAGFGLQAVGMAVFILAGGLPAFSLSALIFGLGVGTLMPAYDSLVSKAVPERLRGIAFGLFQTSLGVISLPAPWLGAQFWEHVGPRLPFAITTLACLVAIVPVYFKFVLPPRPDPSPAVIGPDRPPLT